MRNFIHIILLILLLSSCSAIEDYMLGKDNTPKPKELATLTSKIDLKEDWSLPINKNKNKFAQTKPFLEKDNIFLASNNTLQVIDKNNGSVIWRRALKENIISGPDFNQGYIALGTDNSSIMVLDNEGRQVWQAKVSGDVFSSPIISKNKVIAKTINGTLYAFDLKTGEKLWVVDHGAPNLILQASSSPVATDKFALAGFADGNLDAIDLQSGSILWQKGISFARGSSDVERLVDISSDPIIENNVIYLATYQGYIAALLSDTGEFLWKKNASTYKNLAIDDNAIYMTDSNDIVFAFDKKNGKVLWKQTSLQARDLTAPVLVKNQLVLGDKTGFLHVLSAQNGEFISRTKLTGSIESSPMVSENNMYVITSNGKLNRISLG